MFVEQWMLELTKPIMSTLEFSQKLDRLEFLLTNDFAAALELAERILESVEKQEPKALQAKAYMFTGIAQFRAAQYKAAEQSYEMGLALAEASGNLSIEARCLNGLGLVYYQLGDYNTAISYQLKNLQVVQENDDQEGRIRALINIGVLHDQLEQTDKALGYHQEALSLAQKQNLLRYECICAINVAGYHHDKKAFSTAITLYRETLEKIQSSSEQALEGSLLLNLAKAYLEAGLLEEAQSTNFKALPTNQAAGDRENETETLLIQGRIELELGSLDTSRDYLLRALVMAETIEVKRHQYEAHRYLSRCYEMQKDFKAALYHERCYHQLEREVHNEEVSRKTEFLISKAEAERFRHEAEIERLRNVELAVLNKELEEAREKLVFQAEHDSLTGLANRSVFENRLQRATRSSQLNSSMLAVLFIDLDKFKTVNDTLGHDVGDELLIHVAARLKNAVRRGDLIARMGGDEFTILIENLVSPVVSHRVAQKILAVLNAPYELQKQEIYVTASIGIAIYPNDGLDAMSLKKNADIAMYHVKYQGKNGFQRYNPGLNQQVLTKS
ncbi:MAG: GGDEF domain-containing protein [Trueperaceae bacterium]|nr:GGDEF domain-containing protein [Trueperaceae bacterium]